MERTIRAAAPAQLMGERVRALRVARGISQEELGERAGLHRTYIGHIERGEVNPSLLNICKVAGALQADVAALTHGLEQSIGDPRTA